MKMTLPSSTVAPGAGLAAVLTLPCRRVTQPHQLRGLRLGVPAAGPGAGRAAGVVAAFARVLAGAGVTLDDVELVAVAPHPLDQPWTGGEWDVELSALVRGDVDAIYVDGPAGPLADAVGACRLPCPTAGEPAPLLG
jgi:ABC-type nitrate/sulfonate/bicarbonate transport system substrate-binding protein